MNEMHIQGAQAEISTAAAIAVDAELIALCHEFDALEDELLTYFEGGTNYVKDDRERDNATLSICKRRDAALDRICELRATTAEGVLTRVCTLAKWNSDNPVLSESEYVDDRIIVAIQRDAMEILAPTADAARLHSAGIRQRQRERLSVLGDALRVVDGAARICRHLSNSGTEPSDTEMEAIATLLMSAANDLGKVWAELDNDHVAKGDAA